MRAFVVPRGVTILAGGKAAADAKAFDLVAERGAPVFGVCSGPFLEKEFRTVRYDEREDPSEPDGSPTRRTPCSEIPGQPTFHHTDGNTLKRVTS